MIPKRPELTKTSVIDLHYMGRSIAPIRRHLTPQLLKAGASRITAQHAVGQNELKHVRLIFPSSSTYMNR